MAFDQTTRNRLQSFVSKARAILSEEFTRQLQATYGLDPNQGTIADIESLSHLDNYQLQTAHILRDTLQHYMTTTAGKTQKEQVKLVLERIVREQAFTVLNRLAALRMAEARGFLLESIGSGYSSQGFQLYQMLEDGSHGETGDAYQSYLFSLFDEFGLDLAVLFDRFSVQGRLFPRETALLQLLEQINDYEIEPLWAEDETIGWIYQYFNSQEERKKMRSESSAPRNSRELAVRNQFFTPRYVVEFLTDNTLGRIWYEMTKGNTALVDSCQYLVKCPNEVFLIKDEVSPIQNESELDENLETLTQEEVLSQPVYIPHRSLKDPRTIRMLDPACGSMHFGLYAFDLFEQIYLEAWNLEDELGTDAFEREMELQSLQSTYGDLDSFKQQIPKLIIEHNIHGVDIDPRAVQIAGLSLWQRAQRAWHEQGVKPNQRPTIVKSNIVCAEPMPGEQELLKEFTSTLNPPALGQLVEVIFDKMSLAGEAGTLLKIEQEIQSAVNEARNQWQDKKGSNRIGDLFEEELLAATPQQELGFNLSGIDDETFWEDAEQLILQALQDYSERATSASGEKRLFAEDAAKGFAFIDLSRKRFDVILMNPPFGNTSKESEKMNKKNYPDSWIDLYACFISRAEGLLSQTGLCGALTSKTFLHMRRLYDFRTKLINSSYNPSIIIDLGSNVLDAATVETSASIFQKNIIRNKHCLFFNLTDIEVKESKLTELISQSDIVSSSIVYNKSLILFEGLPDSSFSYEIDTNVLNLFTENSKLEGEFAKACAGMTTLDNERFVRLHWEAPLESKKWVPFVKGGSGLKFYQELSLSVNWSDNGKELKAKAEAYGGAASRFIANEGFYFREGLTYPRVGSSFSVRFLPPGCIFAEKGISIFPNVDSYNNEHLWALLGFLNSILAEKLVELSSPGRFWESGSVNRLPFNMKYLTPQLSGLAKKGYLSSKSLYQSDETSRIFISPEVKDKTNGLPAIQTEIDEVVYKLTGLNQLELDVNYIRGDVNKELSDIQAEKTLAFKKISWLFGCVVGRWIFRADDIDIQMTSTSNSLHNFAINNKGVRNNGVFDLESSRSLIAGIYQLFDESKLSKYLELLEVESLKEYLSNSKYYFSRHLAQYSKNRRYAPIYWPLQTKSGSYTLWVYYHRLNTQTLYSCVNDFVEPKLALVTEDFNTLSSKMNRSSAEEKELTKLTGLQSELKDFRDELLRLAKIWKPNLNDGVQITAAPLWKLFQHTAWQKKLKETWEKLEEGEYDWAHLAASMWSDRVLRKCHQDRSLAIAHDVEDLFWQEVEVPVMRGKKPTGKTKLEWQPIPASETTLNDMVNEAKARLQ